MLFDSTPLQDLMMIIGEVTFITVLALLLVSIALLVIVLSSIRSGKQYFPKLVTSGFSMLEGMIKGICRFFGLEEKELLTFIIRMHNSMNRKAFETIPVRKRAIFFPQCLRSSRCPAHLTPEGIKCVNCGQCPLGQAVKVLGDAGYRVFIVPGSSFIQRMIRSYRPEGIIGVGCIIEVKEGLEMCDRLGLCGIGVVTLKDGCVETAMNWQELLDAAMLGLDEGSVAHYLDISSG